MPKAKEMGYRANQLVAEALIANSQAIQHLDAIIRNRLSAEENMRMVAIAIQEIWKSTGALQEAQQLGK